LVPAGGVSTNIKSAAVRSRQYAAGPVAGRRWHSRHRPVLRSLIGFLILVAVAACSGDALDSSDPWAEVVAAPSDRPTTIADFYELAKPPGDGPFPAVLLLPHCGGIDGRFNRPVIDWYRSHLLREGFVVADVSYLRAHRLATCASKYRPYISMQQIGNDILTAIADLKKHPFVDPAGIHLLGWSYGGGGVLHVLSMAEKRPDVKIKSVVALYPYCRFVAPWHSSVPVLILYGGADNVAPYSQCKAAAKTASANGSLTAIGYPGAYHAFDWFTGTARYDVRFGTAGYNPGAASKAWDETLKFLKSR
jgi:dienelactone hydrolase